MKFVIEPTQSYWKLIEGTSALQSALTAPKDTEILGIEFNHLMCKRPVVGDDEPPVAMTVFKIIGIPTGATCDESLLEDTKYLGSMQFGPRMDRYCLFLQYPPELREFYQTVRKVRDELISRSSLTVTESKT